MRYIHNAMQLFKKGRLYTLLRTWRHKPFLISISQLWIYEKTQFQTTINSQGLTRWVAPKLTARPKYIRAHSHQIRLELLYCYQI